jgi:hypothetical protein
MTFDLSDILLPTQGLMTQLPPISKNENWYVIFESAKPLR